MKKSILRKILAAQVSILFGTYSIASGGTDADYILKQAVNPSGQVCFDKGDVDTLANFKKRCDNDADQLHIFQEQYSKCLQGQTCDEIAANSKTIYWVSMIMALSIGWVAGARSN